MWLHVAFCLAVVMACIFVKPRRPPVEFIAIDRIVRDAIERMEALR